MTIVILRELMASHSHPTSSVKPIHFFLFWSFVDTYSDKSGDLLHGTCLTGRLFGVECPNEVIAPWSSPCPPKKDALDVSDLFIDYAV